jgi:hypothetical protein
MLGPEEQAELPANLVQQERQDLVRTLQVLHLVLYQLLAVVEVVAVILEQAVRAVQEVVVEIVGRAQV